MDNTSSIITSDESEIRAMFGFAKSIDKHPIVYKKKGEDCKDVSSHVVSSIRLVQLDKDKKMGTLEIEIDSGERIRICSAYLKEMQSSKFSFDSTIELDG